MRFAFLLVITAGCRQLLGFEEATVAGDATGDGMVGECTEVIGDPSCTGTTPVCADQQCRACRANDECSSAACLPDGSCAAEEEVAYVAEGGDGDCSRSAACGSIETALATDRPIVTITGVIVDAQSSINDRTVTFLGDPGAKVVGSTGAVFKLEMNAAVTIVGLAISNQANGSPAISSSSSKLVLDRVTVQDCQGRGLDGSQSEIEIRRSTFDGNRLGGVVISSSKFAISNSLFVRNGSTTSTVGGVRSSSSATGSSFELNTVADNLTDASNASTAGVNCQGEVFAAHSNIVAGIANSSALDPTCTFDHSLFTGTSLPPGAGNLVTNDPRFRSVTPGSSGFFRLESDSPAIDQGISTIAFDIDGDPRPSGPAPDMGADELVDP